MSESWPTPKSVMSREKEVSCIYTYMYIYRNHTNDSHEVLGPHVSHLSQFGGNFPLS